MENALISVIVPVYNAEKYLADCVQSIISQTYRNLEIILVDDGSKDSSGSICDSFAEKDSRIKVIHQENAGVSAARNHGLDECHGEYVSFVDSDDYYSTNLFESAVRLSTMFTPPPICLNFPSVLLILSAISVAPIHQQFQRTHPLT